MKTYFAYWYESDEFDQWMQSSEHKTKDGAMNAAFKNASKHGVHLFAEVCESTFKSVRDGWEDTARWVNDADSGKWSGWRLSGYSDAPTEHE